MISVRESYISKALFITYSVKQSIVINVKEV